MVVYAHPPCPPELTAIFSFMGTWNDFMGPLIFLNSQENWTLQLGLNSFIGLVGSQMNLLMACTVMVLLPVLVVRRRSLVLPRNPSAN